MKPVEKPFGACSLFKCPHQQITVVGGCEVVCVCVCVSLQEYQDQFLFCEKTTPVAMDTEL